MDNENDLKYFNRMCRLNKDFNDELFAFGYYQDIVIHYDWEDKE